MMPLDEHYDRDALGPTLARMETKIDNHTDDLRGVSENIAELYNRVGGLEKWKWWVMGLVAAGSTGGGFAVAKILGG